MTKSNFINRDPDTGQVVSLSLDTHNLKKLRQFTQTKDGDGDSARVPAFQIPKSLWVKMNEIVARGIVGGMGIPYKTPVHLARDAVYQWTEFIYANFDPDNAHAALVFTNLKLLEDRVHEAEMRRQVSDKMQRVGNLVRRHIQLEAWEDVYDTLTTFVEMIERFTEPGDVKWRKQWRHLLIEQQPVQQAVRALEGMPQFKDRETVRLLELYASELEAGII